MEIQAEGKLSGKLTGDKAFWKRNRKSSLPINHSPINQLINPQRIIRRHPHRPRLQPTLRLPKLPRLNETTAKILRITVRPNFLPHAVSHLPPAAPPPSPAAATPASTKSSQPPKPSSPPSNKPRSPPTNKFPSTLFHSTRFPVHISPASPLTYHLVCNSG